jgi:DNA-binding HxlR family transcriptional regulator
MQSTCSLEDLIALGRNRWLAPMLVDLASHRGARFVELLHRLDLPRDSLVRTLEAAKVVGWVMPNPGHGHPMRPEYILTEEGMRLAGAAVAIQSAQKAAGIASEALTRWSLPLMRVIDHGEHRFNGVARALPQATPRAISLGLHGLSEIQLIRRSLVEGRPPATNYSLTETGILLARAA